MKSIHLAKADYLRQLFEYATDLYALGDFTSEDPDRKALSAKIEGYASAGTTIDLVKFEEIQRVIDKAHFEKFGEDRSSRRLRILEERSNSKSEVDEEKDWEQYDSPARDRRK